MKSIPLGVIMIMVGMAAISSATTTGIATVMIIGAALVIAGFIEGFQSLGRGDKAFQPLRLVGGVLSVVVGALFLLSPAGGINALSMLLAAYFLASGVFHVVSALARREPQWGWDLGYGLCAIILGAIAIARLPESGMWLVGTLVGVEILLRGLAIAATGIGLTRAAGAMTARTPRPAR